MNCTIIQSRGAHFFDRHNELSLVERNKGLTQSQEIGKAIDNHFAAVGTDIAPSELVQIYRLPYRVESVRARFAERDHDRVENGNIVRTDVRVASLCGGTEARYTRYIPGGQLQMF